MMIKGIDYLGGVNYIDVIERHHPEGFAAGFLMKASGWKNGIKAARALAATGKCSVMRLHGIWHDNHLFTEQDIDIAVKQAKKVAKLQEKYPDIIFYFSPWLEHRASNALFRACKKACGNVLPKEIEIISSGTVPPKTITEVHGSFQTYSEDYIFSFDGMDMLKNQNDSYPLLKWHERHCATLLFGWTPKLNCKRSLNDPTPRQDRTVTPKGPHLKEIRNFLRGY